MISSCAFNTANVSFNLNQSQIQDLYNQKANGTNYGYRIRYTSESTTNPDYNMLRSMEYPTASEQPAFTVTYAYTLPESLSVGEIYLFRNAGSGKYMDVQNGTDANDTNVIQWGWNGSLAQQFKLEQSSTGNGYILRSQVGGKTRVLDIYKTNGRVENGNNVQIYRNVDPKAQEWLILPVDADNFRIVPRSNMSLSLTSYGSANGTANGRTSTSAGNVFVSTYTGADNQLWEIYKTDRTQVKNDIGTVPSGTYYVNNRDTGGYLKRSGTSLSAQAGVILKNTVKTPYQWRITEVNDNQYTIQPANDLTKYLSAAPSTSSVSLSDFPTYWNARYGNNGGAIFTVTSSGKNYALAVVNGIVKLQTLSSTTGTITYNRQVWSLPKTVDYKELTDYTVADMNISVDQSQSPSIIKKPSNAECSLAADFSYTVINGTTEFLSVVNGNQLKGLKQGIATVRATHKPSGIEREFKVAVMGQEVDLPTGMYYIKNVMTDKYLDVDSGIAENNRNVQVYDYNGSAAQKWKIEKQSDGSYKIMSALNEHYNLDVTNGADTVGTNVQIYGSNNSNAQRWRIFENEDGTYTIQPVLSKLNVLGTTTANNAFLRQHSASESQKWILYKETDIYSVRLMKLECECGVSGCAATVCTTRFHNGDVVSFAIDQNGNVSELFNLCQQNKDFLESRYQNYLNHYENGESLEPESQFVWMSLEKMKQTGFLSRHPSITEGSDEYYLYWMVFARAEIHYHESAALLYTSQQIANLLTSLFYKAIVILESAAMQLNQSLYIIPQELQAFTNEIDDVLLSMTHNAASNTVMLGTTTADGIAYNVMAQQLGYTYFHSVNFTALEAMYSKEGMAYINKLFLQEQIDAGKRILFSHDPMVTLTEHQGGYFYKELQYLKEAFNIQELTRSNFVPIGENLWEFRP